MQEFSYLDHQMSPWGSRLRDDLLLSSKESANLATHMVSEFQELSSSSFSLLRDASPIPVKYRLDELRAFQSWMDVAHGASHPGIARAQVITQCYICFAYLKEAWFEALHEASLPGSVTARCCKFLMSEQLRRFRNAFAHGNWRYLEDFSGLEYWARVKGLGETEVRSQVSQIDMSFWQALSRCTAYSTMLAFAEYDD